MVWHSMHTIIIYVSSYFAHSLPNVSFRIEFSNAIETTLVSAQCILYAISPAKCVVTVLHCEERLCATKFVLSKGSKSRLEKY